MPPPKSNYYKGIVRNGRTNAKAELQEPVDQPASMFTATFPLTAPGIANRLKWNCRKGRMTGVMPQVIPYKAR